MMARVSWPADIVPAFLIAPALAKRRKQFARATCGS
jgi:hypothetical protein